MTNELVTRWPIYGYAPGNYSGKCLDCGETFTGDKRAYNCLPCAALKQAARIEADAATIARLEGEVKLWQDRYHHHNRERLDALNCNARQAGLIGQAVVAQREAEAKVAALVATLEKLSCKCSSNCDWEHDDVCPSWTARAAIAAAKGGA